MAELSLTAVLTAKKSVHLECNWNLALIVFKIDFFFYTRVLTSPPTFTSFADKKCGLYTEKYG